MRVEIKVEASQMLGTKYTSEIYSSSVLNLNKGLDGIKKKFWESVCIGINFWFYCEGERSKGEIAGKVYSQQKSILP